MRIPVVALLAISAALSPAQDRLEQTLRQGIIEEEARPNLDAAMKSYELTLSQYGQIPKPNAADRKIAATALFRLAECKRKLGRSDEASEAYRNLVSQFGDQAVLVSQSRARLDDLAASASSSRVEGAPDLVEARKQYRALLEEAVKSSQKYLSYEELQFRLGAIQETDVFKPRSQLLERQLRLAAFDKGVMLQSVGVPGNAGPEGRRLYRQLLVQRVELATKEFAARQRDWQLGVLSDYGTLASAELKLIDAKLEVAALDCM